MKEIIRRFQAAQGVVREYGYDIRTFTLPGEGEVRYAQWLHPKEAEKVPTQAQVDALREFIAPGDTVLDIGAHTGDTTLPMALAAGPAGATFALEPNPYVFKILEANAGLNPEKTRIIALPFAATEEDGTLEFHYSDAGFCNGGYLSTLRAGRRGHPFTLHVEGRNIERYLRAEHPEALARLTYIKVDTEGYDRQVLASLRGLIRETRPCIRAEVLKRLTREERESLYDLLDDLGYEVCRLESDMDYQGPRLARGDLMQWRQFDVFAMPRPGDRATER
jgi:FkbM family methyltransferase